MTGTIRPPILPRMPGVKPADPQTGRHAVARGSAVALEADVPPNSVVMGTPARIPGPVKRATRWWIKNDASANKALARHHREDRLAPARTTSPPHKSVNCSLRKPRMADLARRCQSLVAHPRSATP